MFKDTFEKRLTAVIAVVLLVVIVTGVMAYRNVNVTISSIADSYKPGLKLMYLESMSSRLSYAESSAKSYYFTRDEQYLLPYFTYFDEAMALLDSVEKHIDTTHVTELNQIDTLRSLVVEKKELLNSILLLKNNELVTEELNRLYGKISTAQKKPEPIEKSKKLFKSKEEKQKIRTQKEQAKPENVLKKLTNELSTEIGDVKVDQKSELRSIKLKEFDVLKKDRAIMDKVRQIVFELQENEKKEVLKDSFQVTQQVAKTNTWIAVFSLIALLIMLVMIFVIRNYIKKNNINNQQLKQNLIESEQLASAKESFLYNVSHELKNPLNAVIGFSEQLNTRTANSELKGISQVIYSSSQHLLTVFNDILDISKIKAGKFTFSKIAFSLPQLLDEIKILFQHATQSKGLAFDIDLGEDLPTIIIGDPVRLKQILINLLDNAVKYTPKGSVKLTVKKASSEGNENQLNFSVIDTGVGIAPDDLQKIFDSFEQAKSRDALQVRGTGLGLSITKMLIELQGGNIGIQSKEGEGTQMDFSLSFKSAETSAIAESENTPSSVKGDLITQALEGKRVLLLDDTVINIELFKLILDKYKMQVSAFTTYQETLEFLQNNDVDIVFSDIQLNDIQGKTGFDLCAAIRSMSEPKASLPIIAFSGNVMDIEAYTELGFNDKLEKPYAENQLISTLYNNLNSSSVDAFSFDENILGGQDSLSSSKEDLKNDPQIIKVFIQTINEALPELDSAAVENNVEQLAALAHKLLPGCKILGANDMSELLQKIQKDIDSKEENVDFQKNISYLKDSFLKFQKELGENQV